MKVIIGSDHGAVDLKRRLVRFLLAKGIEVKDHGVFDTASVDYPDIAESVCREFLKNTYDFGILLCGTGIGISISANKMPGIRCALIKDSFSARLAKEHNNANFLAFGGRVQYLEAAESMIEAYMGATFQGERHQRRVSKVTSLEGTDK